MPGSGKSGLVNRYLKYINTPGTELKVIKRPEFETNFRQLNWGLKTTDPYRYTVLKNQNIAADYETALKTEPSRILISDRGLIERRVFLRAYFHQGKISSTTLISETSLLGKVDIPPTQLNMVILMMIRPEISMDRYNYWDNPGPVINMDFLPLLYEQYWRFHYELTCRKTIPFNRYCCIDAEGSMEAVYEQFSHTLNIFIEDQ